MVFQAQTFKSSPAQAVAHGQNPQEQSWFMCWFLAVAPVAALEGVGLPHQLPLLLLEALVEAVAEELNCGFQPYPLGPLKLSLLAQEVLVALLKL